MVSAHWRCSCAEVLLALGNFRFSVELQYRNAYTVELCRCLALVKFIEWILDGISPPLPIAVITGTDCTSVINYLIYDPTITPFSILLH